MNNTTVSTNLNLESDVKMCILCLILIACLFGNVLVSTTIITTKKLRTPSNILIVNLSLCDMMTAICAIPFTLIIFNLYNDGKRFPFGEIGCKILWPFTTYAHNCSVFTLAAIAVERFLSISSMSTKFTKQVTFLVILTIHFCALIVVIPYSYSLQFDTLEESCEEKWNHPWQVTAYTISLYLIQYVLPLIMMAIFYSLAWRKLYTHNMFIINMSEEYERKMDWKRTYLKELRRSVHLGDKITLSSIQKLDNEDRRNQESITLPNKRMSYVTFNSCTDDAHICVPTEDVKRFNKSQFLSQESYIRHRQSVRTMKMFTVVVIVFALSSLPNHITWFLQGLDEMNPIAKFFIILLNYISPVMNCWIYGWFNNGIRMAYLQMLFCSCYQQRFNAQTSLTTSNSTTNPSLYSRRQEEVFRRRMSLFNHMFKEYKENLCIEEEAENNNEESTFIDKI